MFLFGLLYSQHSLGNLTFLSLDDIENKASIFPAKTKKEFAFSCFYTHVHCVHNNLFMFPVHDVSPFPSTAVLNGIL